MSTATVAYYILIRVAHMRFRGNRQKVHFYSCPSSETFFKKCIQLLKNHNIGFYSMSQWMIAVVQH